MKAGLLISILLICGFIAMFLTGCAGYPKGMQEYRQLTDDEQARMVEITLGTDEVKQLLEEYGDYGRADNCWGYFQWRKTGGEYKIAGINAICGENPEENPFPESERAGELYYVVVVSFGEPPEQNIRALINPDTEKVADLKIYEAYPHR